MADPVPAPAPIVAPPATKKWYASLTVWGAIISGASASIQSFTSTIDASAGTHWSTNPIFTGIIAILGAIIAIIGRFQANTVIK